MPTQFLQDIQTSFLGGQDASKAPQFVAKDAYFSGVNLSTEKGLLKPRWGMDKLRSKLKFPTGGVKRANGTTKSYKDIFQTGKFQAIAPYSIGADFYLALIISGQIFLVNQRSFSVQHLKLDGEQMNPRAPITNWSPAGKYLVFSDFPNFPVIIDGITVRRSDPKKDEIPVCNILGYNQNRLFIGSYGNEFTAGDPVGNLATPDAPITFTEYLEPSTGFTGQIFQLNTNYNNDPITSFAFLQATDASTGIGPLLVSTQTAIYSYLTQNPRNTWTAGQFGQMFVYNAGVVGPRAITNLNSDVFFISADYQVRSAAMSRQEQGKWSKTPVSKEVQNWLIVQDKAVLPFTFIQYFKNKIFVGANPYRTSCRGINDEQLPDYANGGMAVMELDNISTLKEESNPSWAGLWTGCRPMAMAVNNERCFVISKDGGTNELYEIRPDLSYDLDGNDIRMIKSKLYTREYDFDSSFNDKVLHSVDLQLSNIKGDFEATVRYKSDQAPTFVPWRTFKHSAPWRNCNTPFFFNGLAGQSFKRIVLGTPPNANKCNPVTQDLLQSFERVQLEITLEGIYWELRGIRTKADLNQQSENINSCKTFPIVPLANECSTDWSIGDFQTCLLSQT